MRTLITQDQLANGILTSQLADGAEFIQRDGSVTMTGDLNMGSQKLVAVATPTVGTDGANKDYVDNKVKGLVIKASVRAATTANITLSGTQTIDGVSLSVSDRVLVKDQSTAADNGIYVVAAGAWSRADDADQDAEVTAGMTTFVSEGTANGNQQWSLTTDDPITVGVTNLVFTQTGGGATAYVGGAGMVLSGSTFNVQTVSSSRIVVNADDIDLGQPTIGGSGAGSGFTKVSVDVYGRVTNTGAAAPGDIGAQPEDADLTALAALASTGIVTRTAANTYALRTITGTASNITVTNGDGVSANPIINLASVTQGAGGNFVKVTLDGFGRVTQNAAVGASDITTALGYTPVDNAKLTWNEAVSGTVNGSNTAFTIAATPATGKLLLYVNGVLQRAGAGNDYTISGTNITMLYAPKTDSVLLATYLTA